MNDMNDMNDTRNMYLALYEKYEDVGEKKVPTGQYRLGFFVKGDIIPTPNKKDRDGNTLNGIQLYSDFLGSQTVIGQMQWDKIGNRPANPNVLNDGVINAEYDQHYGLKQVSQLTNNEVLSQTDIAYIMESFIAGAELKDEVAEQLEAQMNAFRSENNMNRVI